MVVVVVVVVVVVAAVSCLSLSRNSMTDSVVLEILWCQGYKTFFFFVTLSLPKRVFISGIYFKLGLS